MQLSELRDYLDTLLDAPRLKDYCPNGLQVEGRAEVARVLCGVTASQALLDHAVAGGYDAVFVHHGYFWKGEDGRICGIRRQRLRTLLANDVSLFAYHLPLDVHPELGNNAQLAQVMGWQAEGRFADQDLGWIGRVAPPPGAGRCLCAGARDRAQAGAFAAAGGGWRAYRSPCRLVHRRGARLFRAGDPRGGRCFCIRRDFRADCASCARVGRALHRRRTPCHRALWCACDCRAPERPAGADGGFRRSRQSRLSAQFVALGVASVIRLRGEAGGTGRARLRGSPTAAGSRR